jgi:isocitrate dehydrogenase (NAD+)
MPRRAPTPAGIGPEIAVAVQKIFEAAKAPIAWDEQHVGKQVDPTTNSFVSRENLDSVLVREGEGRTPARNPPGSSR